MLHEVPEYLPSADIIVSAVNGSLDILSAARIGLLMQARGGKPVLIIDIAVPRSVPPELARMDGVQLVNIDDLKNAADRGLDERRKAVEKAEAILKAKLPGVTAHLAAGEMVHVLAAIRSTAEQIRREWLEQAVDTLAMPPEQRQSMDSLSKSMVRKILFESEVKLREYSNGIRQ